MKKKSNPMKVFNDAFDKRKAGLKKAQDGIIQNSTAPKVIQDAANIGAPSSDYNNINSDRGSYDTGTGINSGTFRHDAPVKFIPGTAKKGGQTTYNTGGAKTTVEYAGVKKSDPDYTKKVAAGKKAGYMVDQPGAYKANLTDTAQVTYMKPLITNPNTGGFDNKKGGSVKSKKK